MSSFDRAPNHPWDDGVYGTGHTQPPKNHGGLIAVLLIFVIFLSGLVTVLGIMNIRLFRQLNEQEEEDTSIAFAAETADAAEDAEEPVEEVAAPEEMVPTEAMDPDVHLDLRTSPEVGDEEAEEDEARPERMPLQKIYEQCIPSVVSIMCTQRSGSSTGTGVILSEQGYIVTNYHVIENASQVAVQLTDERIYTAMLVGSDPASDLAVLFIEAEDLTAAEFGDSDHLRVGDSVVAIGDPLGVKYRGTMTNGIISAINRNVTINGRTMNLIQTDAALNSGNSGGPLINVFGQVVGINTMKIGAFADSAGVEGIGFAIPSTVVKDIVDQIIAQGYVSGRPSLGLQGESISIFYQRYYRLPAGLYITEVVPGSEAEANGIQPGDVLISLDGTNVYSMDELNTLLYNYSAGDTVRLVIYRGGFTASCDITLAEAHG